MRKKALISASLAAGLMLGVSAYPAVEQIENRQGITAQAATGTTTDGWEYSANDTNCVITGAKSTLSGDATIPASITLSDGKTLPVTRIGTNSLRSNSKLTGLTIPEGVTEIGEYAISECPNLKKVTLPASLQIIEGSAFNQDKALETVEMPKGVIEISGFAFSNCTSLKNITLPDSLTTIGRDAFHSCTSLKSINIPGTISTLGPWAFAECSTLETVKIANGIQSFSSTFEDCTQLKEITFPASVTTLSYPFDEECTHLTSVTIENPDCKINFRIFKAEEETIIYGYEGSTAQQYCEANGEALHAVFKSIGEKPEPQKDYGEFCDANGDGKVDVVDAQLVLIYYVEDIAGNKPSWYQITGNPKAPDAP